MTSSTINEAPEFPGARAAKCPFDPPPEIQALQERAPLTRVRLPDGTTPWLVTRYAEQRALLGDSRVSAGRPQARLPEPGARRGGRRLVHQLHPHGRP